MSDTIERILHTRYRVKVGEKYYVLYFESSGEDVIISSAIEELSDGSGQTLSVVLRNLRGILDTLAKKPVATSALALKNLNPLLISGQLGIELDTLRMKVGDGLKRYNQLPYLITQEIPSDRVFLPQGIDGLTDDGEQTLTNIIREIKRVLDTRLPLYEHGDKFKDENPILGNGQLAVENNTGYVKIGDGETAYNDLKYFAFRSFGTSATFHYPLVAPKIILTTLNPTLLENQIAIETDTLRVKIGDGHTPYDQLPYMDSESKNIRMPVMKTAAEFIDEDDVYTAERVLFETDTGRYKIADGLSCYTELDYVNAATDESGLASSSTAIVAPLDELNDLDPILNYGQLGISADGTKIVIGDGVTPFSQLTPIDPEGLVIMGTQLQLEEIGEFVPKAGQIVLETDTGRYKIGDGVTTINNLPYVDENSGSIVGRTYHVLPRSVKIFDPEGFEVLYDNMGATDKDGNPYEDVYIQIKKDIDEETSEGGEG